MGPCLGCCIQFLLYIHGTNHDSYCNRNSSSFSYFSSVSFRFLVLMTIQLNINKNWWRESWEDMQQRAKGWNWTPDSAFIHEVPAPPISYTSAPSLWGRLELSRRNGRSPTGWPAVWFLARLGCMSMDCWNQRGLSRCCNPFPRAFLMYSLLHFLINPFVFRAFFRVKYGVKQGTFSDR